MTFRRFAMMALAVATFGGQAALAKSHVTHCRNAKGRFTKCTKSHKPMHCRDEKGRFMKCDKKAMKKDMKSDISTPMDGMKKTQDMSMPYPRDTMKSDMNMPAPPSRQPVDAMPAEQNAR